MKTKSKFELRSVLGNDSAEAADQSQILKT